MLEILIVYIFVMFGGRVCQQRVGIPTGTNRAPLFADMFLYSYVQDFIPGLLEKNNKKLAQFFNVKSRYMYDVLSLNSSKLGDDNPH